MPPLRDERDERDEEAIADALAALSVAEIVEALSAREAPRMVRRAIEQVARVPSRRLGQILARFDRRIHEVGLGDAAREVLHTLGARVEVRGSVPRSSPVLVVTNHPGAYDAFATMASIGRDDIALVASEREFLRAMPHVTEHLVFVADSRSPGRDLGRAVGLRRALSWLEAGHVLVQFGAGAIEPDARFLRRGEDLLGSWLSGTGLLAFHAAALGAVVVPTLVSGVHSHRAKRLAVVRWAERRGVSTVAPLIQATLPGFRDVAVSVQFGPPIGREALEAATDNQGRTALLRASVAALHEVTS